MSMANAIQNSFLLHKLDSVEVDGRHQLPLSVNLLGEDGIHASENSGNWLTIEAPNGNHVTLPDENHVEFSIPDNSDRIVWKDATEAALNTIREASTHANLRQAVQQVSHLAQEGVYVPKSGLIQLLQRCLNEHDLVLAREAHHIIKICGLNSDSFIGSHLIRMFGAFGCLTEAMEAFASISQPTVFAWNAIISTHVGIGNFETAIQMYTEMQDTGVEPDGRVFVTVLKACMGLRNLEQSNWIHHEIAQFGLDADIFVGSTLIDMYAKCGNLRMASQIFYKMNFRNIVTWSALIGGYSQHGHDEEALALFEQMRAEGSEPNSVTFASVLKACSHIEAGRQVHSYIVEQGLESNDHVSCMLVNMYVKSTTLSDALIMFERLQKGGILTCNALVVGLCQYGYNEDALDLFKQMRHEGIKSDLSIYNCIVKACVNLGAFQEGLLIHSCMVENIVQLDVYSGSSLIDLYSKAGDLRSAEAVFQKLPEQNVVTWSALITAFLQHGCSEQAFNLFEQMKQEGILPDNYTLVAILKACSDLSLFEQGRKIHATLIEGGFDLDTLVSNALMDMYIRWNHFSDAYKVFNKLPSRDVVTWTTLMAGSSEHEDGAAALGHYAAMLCEGIQPSTVTFLVLLRACSSVAALDHGRYLHAELLQCGFSLDVFISSALIDMYSRCGCLEDAHMVFHRLNEYDTGVWSAMINGYSQHSNYQRAFSYFESMQRLGFKPDSVTFLCILSACNRAGLVQKGRRHLKAMRDAYGFYPGLEHMNCMVDLLGNANFLDEARDLLETIPFRTDIVGWMSLLSSCKRYLNVDIGRQCFEHILLLDRRNVSCYVLMSDIYTACGKEKYGENIEELRLVSNGWKKPGKAFIEVNKEIHSFFVGDKEHPKREVMYEKLKELKLQMKMEEPTSVLGSISNQSSTREDELCGHCEKLALSFGLLHTPQGVTIRISKNLRMCAVCHRDIQFISKAEKREIIIVDACLVHHFKEGLCQCQMYSV